MAATLTSIITTSPIAESRHVTRERTFKVLGYRPDFNDVTAQLLFIISQLHTEHFTGNLTINFTQGSVNNVKVLDSKSITPS